MTKLNLSRMSMCVITYNLVELPNTNFNGLKSIRRLSNAGKLFMIR